MSRQFTFEPDAARLTQKGWLEPNLIGRLTCPIVGRKLRRRFPTVAGEIRDYLHAGRGAS